MTGHICVLTALVLAASFWQQQHRTADSATDCTNLALTPVLFVHGSGLDSSSWTGMRSALSKRGYPAAYLKAMDLIPNDGDNIAAAVDQISHAMNALLDDSQQAFEDSQCEGVAPDKGVIVSHSMGAVSGRWYASRVDPGKVSALIAIAGSNHGTDALCGLSGSGNKQMCPAYAEDMLQNEVQVVLNGTSDSPVDETPFGVGVDKRDRTTIPPDADRRILYLTIRIDPDEWITPAESAILDGAGGSPHLDFGRLSIRQTTPGNFILPAESSHDTLPANPTVVEFVATTLDQLSKLP